MSQQLGEKSGKIRVEWIDILRGMMMFLVVLGHTLTHKGLVRYIFSFHMPIFFIISGMTFSFNKEFHPVKYLKKKAIGLLVPYFSLNILVSGLWYLNGAIRGSNKTTLDLIKGIFISNVDSGFTMGSNTTWFITCLFLTDIYFFALKRLCKRDSILTAVVIGGAMAFYAAGGVKEKGGGIWHWQVVFTAAVFYLAGYLFMKHIKEIQKAVVSHVPAVLLLAGLLLLLGYRFSEWNGRVSMVNDSYKNIGLFYAAAFATSFAIILLVMLLSEMPAFLRLMRPITFVGRNTLTYIAFHVPIIKLVRWYFNDFFEARELHRLFCASLIYIGLFPVAWLIKKYLPFAVGRGFQKK